MKSERKEILYLLHLPPPVHGSSVVGEQIKGSRLINDAFRGKYINLILSRKVNESGKMNLVKIVRLVKIWLTLLATLIRHKPHLCYYALTTTGPGFRKDVILIALLRLFHTKIIYHIHNRGIINEKNNRLNDLFYRFVFNQAPVILLSRHLYYDVEEYVPESNVYYCANGISDYQPRIAFLSKTGNRPFRILFFSNLMREKGVFILVEACKILLEKGYHFQCEFVGGESDVTEKKLTDFAGGMGLDGHVKYLGKRYGKLKEMVFEEADIFVLPSRCDCFPLVILEAMQHRLPVISYAVGGIPEIVDEGVTGYLLHPQGNANDLAERIESLIQNPSLREEMGTNGRVKYENFFTKRVFERRLLSILQDVIN